MGVTGYGRCWRCELLGEADWRQLISDDGWAEISRQERYQDVMLAKSLNDAREEE